MITFRPKSFIDKDLREEAIAYLEKKNVNYTLITAEEADPVSRVNSRAMVLLDFRQTNKGTYSITVQEKNGYKYTQKLLGEKCGMKITEIIPRERKTTAEASHIGQALDAIEILGLHYNLSIVESDD